MQSGISASKALHDAFNDLVSSPDQRAVLAGIERESLVPVATIPLKNNPFTADLEQLKPHLTPNRALYILLKLSPTASDGYAAITYVPNAAPVRQKMLFASTRLTLVRELGIERFGTSIFATEAEELSAAGWARHEAHASAAAPLTAEEDGLRGVKEAEAREATGTGTRRGHVAARVDVTTGAGVLESMRCLQETGCRGTLVQFRFDLPDETLQLESSKDGVEPAALAAAMSASEPRYAFYSHPDAPQASEAKILFIYTCPTTSRIKERMVYSTGKSWVRTLAERDADITITKSLEATEPGELTVEVLSEAAGFSTAKASATTTAGAQSGGAAAASSSGFARPKRPGRR